MMRFILAATLLLPTAAFACGDKAKTASADGETVTTAKANIDPTHCAKKAELVGSNCSYATGMMAQRVLEQGNSYSFTGTLSDAGSALDSKVAAPYVVGPEASIRVLANEVIGALVDAGARDKRIELAGKLLEVDGITYFVATTYGVLNS